MNFEDFVSCIKCIAMDYEQEVDMTEPGWKSDWEKGKDPHESFFDCYPFHESES